MKNFTQEQIQNKRGDVWWQQQTRLEEQVDWHPNKDAKPYKIGDMNIPCRFYGSLIFANESLHSCQNRKFSFLQLQCKTGGFLIEIFLNLVLEIKTNYNCVLFASFGVKNHHTSKTRTLFHSSRQTYQSAFTVNEWMPPIWSALYKWCEWRNCNTR